MHSANLLVLLASGAAAQSVTVINFGFNSPLTLKGSDSKATTYEVVCPASTSGTVASTSVQSGSATTRETATDAASSFATNLDLSPITALPTPTGKARLRRQKLTDDPGNCEPYTLLQGPSTWEIHITDPTPGVFTYDASCNWSGELTAAEVSCTATLDGDISSDKGISTVTFKTGELKSLSALQTVSVVQPSGSSATSTGVSSGFSSSAAPSNGTLSATPTPTPSTSASASASGQSTGLAAPGPLPTGAMAFVGGAAGLLAAALAL